MYPAHFGLKKRLFDAGIARDAAVFRCARREPIAANLEVAFTSPNAITTLSGTAGVGKTTLIASALRATTTRLALGWLSGIPTNGSDLLELLLVEFGFSAHRATRIERLQMWRQFLSEMSATDSRVFIVVERTEDLAPEVLRALDALTAADTSGCAGANVVLLGNEGLDEHLMPPLLESLRQRIRLRQRLTPFTLAELEDYLRHHVARAGGDFERLFAPGTVAALHQYSAGIARVANNLCDTALALAAAEGQPQLTPQLVAMTAVGWFGRAADAPAAAVAKQPVEPALPATPTSASPAAPRQAAPSRPPLTDTDATDIVGLATMDVPVLNDVFEEPPPAATPRTETAPATTRTTAAMAAPAPKPAPVQASAQPAAVKPAASVAATTPTASKAPTSTDHSADADQLRQTQTMRAISGAASIDDISNSMAEALFGDVDLEMLTAALAAGWSEESGTDTVPSPATEALNSKATTPGDDLFDALNLGRDALLELSDDPKPAQSPQPRKTATQR